MDDKKAAVQQIKLNSHTS